MRVGFYHVPIEGRSQRVVKGMIRSVRQAMPDVELVHMTDSQTSLLVGAHRAIRIKPMPLALACLEAYASVDGEWLFIDTDVVVREDVRRVFEQPFDVAVATRDGTLKPGEVGSKFMSRMPFNKGAVFSRSQAFWQAAVARCRRLKADRHEWMGDQQAMNDVIRDGQFNVLTLPSRYNYAPITDRDDLSGKAIIHFKGSRKAWMPVAV